MEGGYVRGRGFRASVKFIRHSFELYAIAIQCIMRFISIARTFAREYNDNDEYNDVIEIIPLIIINVGIF